MNSETAPSPTTEAAARPASETVPFPAPEAASASAPADKATPKGGAKKEPKANASKKETKDPWTDPEALIAIRDRIAGVVGPTPHQIEQAKRMQEQLVAPFPEADIEWVVKEEDVRQDDNDARCFAYVSARAVMGRLDAVFGFGGWASKLVPCAFAGDGLNGFAMELSCFIPGKGWVTKTDAADLSRFEAVKGGASGALKRSAVQFGIGRYLYDLPANRVALSNTDGEKRIRPGGRGPLRYWNPPLLPPWALPESERPAREKVFAEMKEAELRAAEAREKVAALRAEEERKAADARAAKTPPAPQSRPATETPPAASAPAAPADTPSASSTAHAEAKALSAGMLSDLRGILGHDDRLSVAYLKFKKLLPSGAVSLEQVPVSIANQFTLLPPEKKQPVVARMKHLASVAKLIGGAPYEAASTLFHLNGLTGPGQQWFEAANDKLDEVPGKAEMVARLDKLSAVAKLIGQHPHESADGIFVGKGYIKPGQHWFEAANDKLDETVAKSGPFQKTVAKFSAGKPVTGEGEPAS